jgi:hypothetical protein
LNAATNDAHALAIAKEVVRHLNRKKYIELKIEAPSPPIYDARFRSNKAFSAKGASEYQA